MQPALKEKLVFSKSAPDGIMTPLTIPTGISSQPIEYPAVEPTGPRGPVAKEKKNGI